MLSDVKEPSEDEIMSLLHASRQLGSDYDQDIARQLADRIRSWSPTPAKPERRSTDSEHKVQIIATAMALSIPILAIAGWAAHADGFYAVLGLDAIIILSALWR